VFAHQDFIPITGHMALTRLSTHLLERIIGFVAPSAQRQQGVSPTWFPGSMQAIITTPDNDKSFWALDLYKLLFVVRTSEHYIIGVVWRTRAQATAQTWW
jgi:hypothetical protein